MKRIKKIFLMTGLFFAFVVTSVIFTFITAKYKTTKVKIGDTVFSVEVAETVSQKAKGLSGRKGLGNNQGMLFVFNSFSEPSFWMLGMKFPIDIIWIKGGRVAGIERNIPADSLDLYYPPEPIDRALEISAGLSEKLNIRIGDALEVK
ncbi:MAG: hypothetical protein A3H63_00355 [Candidatus Harrisonbacteria bacterium RIFCSPLOWO2_02_FULL_45_10c]|uniref:DUF192 domain-containing protein n=1 Tax=Candidatus Harrisonbacteria bacterium RIFCSPLOWO2_02_FULL_45_10c TaxID=1798410 RepID=A0A1G1ZRG1_9BACT|nr:MAG: hypothetical protein A3H63_00355 [Candidatus Harrisonbacteria bacterium RIFCSPLOWO2_02_FULL_45_10c]